MCTTSFLFVVIFHTVAVASSVTNVLFQKPRVKLDTRVTGTGSTSLTNVTSYTHCTQLCLLKFPSTCNFVNYHKTSSTCEISETDLVNPYLYTVAQEEGWSHMVNTNSISIEWNHFFNGWDLVMKATKENGYSMYDLWSGSSSNIPTLDTVQLATGSSTHFKSAKVEDWANLNVKKVKFAFFTDGEEVFSLVFNGKGSTKMNWFAKGRLLEDPYTDLTSISSGVNYFNIAGWGGKRRFYISANHGSCSTDSGWIVTVDPNGACSAWDKQATNKPFFAYSKLTTKLNWSQKWGTSSVGFPKIAAIFLQYG